MDTARHLAIPYMGLGLDLDLLPHHSHANSCAADSEDSTVSTASSDGRGMQGLQPPRQKINARERYRTFNVNAAYEALRFLIPTEPVDRKLSKIEVIRLANSYISHLRCTLHMGTYLNPCQLQRGKNENRTESRVSICTFCMKPK